MSLVLSGGKRELILALPWMNSAGMLGFGAEARPLLDLNALGAFVTSPISLRPRTPARGRRTHTLPGGLLLHTGLPNPGLHSTLVRELPFWESLKVPLLLHLLLDEPQDLPQVGSYLEQAQRVDGVEIGLEIIHPDQAADITREAARLQLPFILRLPLDCPDEVYLAADAAGAPAVAIGPPRGRLPGPQGGFFSGRMYGPSLFPHLLEKLYRLRPGIGGCLIAGAGLFTSAGIYCALQAGADAVQLDTLLWTHPEILDELMLDRRRRQSEPPEK
jgi:dihydroorotate dehydrogenase (NAD+) catalytic subunit